MKCDKRSKLAQNTHGGSPGKSISTDSGHSDSSAAVSAGRFSGWAILAALALILLAAVAAYHNSLSGPLIFDDAIWIKENPNIQHLWPIWPVLFPSDATMVGGRPVVSLTLAINYALGGLNVWGYHALNLAIHILAAWTLLGVIRRTLLLPQLRERFGSVATPLALAAVILWMVHPLQTESVTYIIQRTEALMGLLYLLVLYGLIRGATSGGSRWWYVAAVMSCLLGMATKEVTATAPVIILVYDRIFLAGSFREAWRQRYGFYLALAATWGMVPLLLISTGFYGGTTGFAVKTFSWWSYLLTQPGVIVHYLGLTFWPSGLCLDYGWPAARSFDAILLPGVLVAALLALTIWALVKRREWGFLGVWFFAILAPSSSFVPIRDAAYEHRMYLPLAAVATGVVVGGWVAGQQLVRRGIVPLLVLEVMGGALVLLAGVALGILTFQRNVDYQSELSIWADAVAKAPGNARVHNNLGIALAGRSQIDEAMAHYRKALELKPDYAEAHSNLGNALTGRGQIDEAMAHYRRALEVKPDYAEAHNNLGNALVGCGRFDEAITQYQKVLEVKRDSAEVHNNLGNALAGCRRFDEAITQFQKALEVKPDYVAAHYDLGNALVGCGRFNEAITHFQKALEIKPDYVTARNNLGNALVGCGRFDEAITQYQKALEVKPDYVAAHYNLGNALVGCGRFDEAITQYQKALEVKPDYADARNTLGSVQSQREEIFKGLAERRELLHSRPDDVALLNDTAWLLATNPNASIRNGTEAVELAQRAERLSEGREPAILGTLAAAYAEAGRFAEALQTARKAMELATQQDKQPLAKSIRAKIPLYEAGTPFHAMPQPAAAGPLRP